MKMLTTGRPGVWLHVDHRSNGYWCMTTKAGEDPSKADSRWKGPYETYEEAFQTAKNGDIQAKEG